MTSRLATAVLILVFTAGCQRSEPSPAYAIVAGAVTSRLEETGELTIDLAPESRSSRSPESIACVLTSDSEIYVSEQFAALSDVPVGARVEIVGQWQRDRLVVGTLRVERPLPAVPIPAILSSDEWPATLPAEDEHATPRPASESRPAAGGN
jgi:hypothetical protein